MRRWHGISVALVVAAGDAGCAALVMDGPQSHRAVHEAPRCSESRGAVVLDGVMATGIGIGSLAAMASEEGGVALGTALLAGLFVASAVAGSNAASDCEHANRDFESYLAGRAVGDAERELAAEDAASPSPSPSPTPSPSPSLTPSPTPSPSPAESASAPESAPAEPASAPAVPAEPAAPAPTKRSDRRDRWRDFWQEVNP